MVVQRNYVIGIIDYEKIHEVNDIVRSYSNITQESTSHMYFVKQPVNPNKYVPDTTFFQLEAENESSLDKKVDDLINALDELTLNYVLKDEESGKLLSVVEHGGKLIIKFDKLHRLDDGIFKQIDDLKQSRTDLGFCRGFKPDFRPIEGRSIEDVAVNPEIIYLISDSPENLSKFTDYISDKIMEINPNFELEFKHFRKANEYGTVSENWIH